MISIYQPALKKEPTRNLDEKSFFDSVKNGEWQDEVLNYRAKKKTLTKDEADAIKKKLTGVSPSGVFNPRNANGLIKHSGLICIDIDAKDQICPIDEEQLKENEYCYALHRSVGGEGFAMYIKIDKTRHIDSFLGLEKYLLDELNIVIDKSCKDVCRLRFVSYDPDLYINEKAKLFKKYLPKVPKKQQIPQVLFVKSDFDEMVNKASSMNLFDDYKDYIEIAFALASEFKENGRIYFHSLCSGSAKYDRKQADKDYDKAVRRNETGITIKTFYYHCKNAGIPLVSEKTKQLKRIAKLADNPKKELEIRGLKDEENLIDKIKSIQKEEITGELADIIELIKISNIRFNEVTRNFDFDGQEMTDRVLAEFYTKVWSRINDGISKDKIFTLIQNKSITTSFNPITDWFIKNQHLQTENEFDKLKACFDFEADLLHDGELYRVDEYLDIFLRKWLIGIIASAHGTYSLMILVLIGEQGTNKTKFFRNLLPTSLRKFYAESNLDEGKDSEILMTKKLLIIDDEFGGKNKKDATKLKRLTSQQTFSIRMPFGRVSEDLNRLAVLGGTSNEDEVINDPTGNRRIIPINIKNFDFEAYEKINKDKLFIELYKEWKNNPEGWFLDKLEIQILNESTRKNTETMAEIELINKYFEFYEYGNMTNTDIRMYLEGLHFSLKTTAKRIGQAMKKCGFENFVAKIDGKPKRFYKCIVKNVNNL